MSELLEPSNARKRQRSERHPRNNRARNITKCRYRYRSVVGQEHKFLDYIRASVFFIRSTFFVHASANSRAGFHGVDRHDNHGVMGASSLLCSRGGLQHEKKTHERFYKLRESSLSRSNPKKNTHTHTHKALYCILFCFLRRNIRSDANGFKYNLCQIVLEDLNLCQKYIITYGTSTLCGKGSQSLRSGCSCELPVNLNKMQRPRTLFARFATVILRCATPSALDRRRASSPWWLREFNESVCYPR